MKRLVLVMVALLAVSFVFGKSLGRGVFESLLCLFPVLYISFNLFIAYMLGVKANMDKQKLTNSQRSAYDILVNSKSSDPEIALALVEVYGVRLEAVRNALVTCYVGYNGNADIKNLIEEAIRHNFGDEYADQCANQASNSLASLFAGAAIR